MLNGKALLLPDNAPKVEERLSIAIEQETLASEDVSLAKEFIQERSDSFIEIR
jgi:hypothetical protein